MKRTAYHIVLVLMMLATLEVAVAGTDGRPSLGGDAGQQSDPTPKKTKEITATIARSVENETITLTAVFPDEANVKVSLFNLLGRLVEVHSITSVQKGETAFRFRTKGLPNGPYIIMLEANGQRIINKVMVAR